MKKTLRLLGSFACIISMVLFIGCDKKEDLINNKGNEQSNTGEVVDSSKDNKVDLWLAYWETDGFEEAIDYWSGRISNIVYFAAYFDVNNKLFVPNSISNSKEIVDLLYKDKGWGNYISFVNDKVKSNGESILKDTELLYEVFESDEAMEAHIEDIINLAIEGGYSGIEIDYEKIRKDLELWNKFSIFLSKLIDESKEYELSLRVLLEPSTPIDKITLPQGPEYIMMCYNLYGYGTEPGPKANEDFLLELIHKMKPLCGNKGFALATGGFDFGNNGDVKAITKEEAKNLLIKYNVSNEVIDENSNCKVFKYVDDNGASHEVWYADTSTLEYWEGILRENGEENISIWKLDI